MLNHIDVAAAVIQKDNKVFVARRAPKEHLGGKCEFPGGKIEPNEKPEECLKRELAEELGIEVDIGEYITESIYAYDEKKIRLIAYAVEYKSGEIKLSVHDHYEWAQVDELFKFDFAAADWPIVKYISRM